MSIVFTSALNRRALLQAKANHLRREQARLEGIAHDAFVGQRVRFVGSFNGQPHGRSKKSLAGQEAVITSVCLDELLGVTFHSAEPRWIQAGFTMRDVEFI